MLKLTQWLISILRILLQWAAPPVLLKQPSEIS